MERHSNLSIMNLSDFTSLSSLERKGNLGYANQLYNPLNYFKFVYHISFDENDGNIKLENPTIKVHTIKIIWKRIPVIRWIANMVYAFAKIYWIARKNKVCLVRGRGLYHGSLLGLMVARVLGIPFIVSIGGNQRLSNELSGQYPLYNSFFSDREEEMVIRSADMVICPNEYSRKYAVSLGVLTKRTCVIPLRLRDDIYNFRCDSTDILKKSGIDETRPIVLSVSRLEGDKQVDMLLAAIPLVVRKHPDVQFVFIGDGSMREEMECKVKMLGLDRNVYFLGFQPTEAVKYCLGKASMVCVLMSGFVTYEAAAAGKAIVAFDVEWHSEFIRSGETGLLVKNRDWMGLAEAISWLLDDTKVAEQLGKNARELVKSRYNPNILAEKEIAKLLGFIKHNKGGMRN